MTLQELHDWTKRELETNRRDGHTQIGYLLDESDAKGATEIERHRPIMGFVQSHGKLLGRS